jgi:hypothetical protein
MRVRAKYIDKNLPLMINHVTDEEKMEHIARLRTISVSNSFADNEIVQTSL